MVASKSLKLDLCLPLVCQNVLKGLKRVFGKSVGKYGVNRLKAFIHQEKQGCKVR